jgi:iron complex outermembrane receptor protein
VRPWWWNEVRWGLGYRVSADDIEAVPTIALAPAARTIDVWSAFVQDEVTLVPDRLRLTGGTKLEHNDFSGFEVQPAGRLLWTPHANHTAWAGISRAVRTPSRIEHDLEITAKLRGTPGVFARLLADEDFEPEKVVNYQAGYRVRPMRRLFLDVVGFYNRFTDLLSAEPGTPFTEAQPPPPHVVLPFTFGNGLHGESYGAELAADAAVTDWWRVNAAYSYLQLKLRPDASSRDISSAGLEGSSPHNLATLRSMMNLPARFELDTVLRYVDNLPGQGVGSYIDVDVRVARRVVDSVELSVVGHNLVHDHHREFAGGTEVERGVYGQVRWWW